MHGLPFRLGEGGEAGQQRVAQQRVQAEPGLARRVFDAVDKVVFAFQPQEQRGHVGDRARRVGERGAQRCTEAQAGRRAHEQVEFAGRQVRAHLVLEVVGQGGRIAGRQAGEGLARGGERGGFPSLLLPVERKEAQTGDPAFAEFVQGAHGAGIDLAKLRLQELGTLRRREAQVVPVELQRLGLAAQPLERQPQTAARDQHQVQVGRGVVQQPLQCIEDRGVAQPLQVVEHQRHIARMCCDAAHQRDDLPLDGIGVGADARGGLVRQRCIDLRQAGKQAFEEAGRVVVVRARREPGDVETHRNQGPSPGRDERGLAGARRPGDGDATQLPRFGQARQQALASDRADNRAPRRLGLGRWRGGRGRGRHRGRLCSSPVGRHHPLRVGAGAVRENPRRCRPCPPSARNPTMRSLCPDRFRGPPGFCCRARPCSRACPCPPRRRTGSSSFKRPRAAARPRCSSCGGASWCRSVRRLPGSRWAATTTTSCGSSTTCSRPWSPSTRPSRARPACWPGAAAIPRRSSAWSSGWCRASRRAGARSCWCSTMRTICTAPGRCMRFSC
ncbi:hypothetical protein D9M72_295540 [compost metagenome]